jgi:hypothetical protein
MTAAREALRAGARLFDDGAFFEAHEVWEDQWRVESNPGERRLLQGLIQIAAGFHKLLVMNAPESAVRLLERGLAKLDPGPVDLDLAPFLEGIRACAGAIAAGGFDRAAIPGLAALAKG